MPQYLSDEEREYYERTRKPIITIPKSRLGMVFFGLGVVVWFAILMLPCAMFSLATGGEIRISHGDIPEREAHPLFQLNLVMDIDNRGFQITRSSVLPDGEQDVCIQTHVSYIMWETDGTAESVSYCDCYERAASDSDWQYLPDVDACN